MTMEEMFKKLALILDKTEMQVKQTPYVLLLNEMVEEFFLYVDEEYFKRKTE